MSKYYSLLVRTSNTCPQVKKVINSVKEKYRITGKSNRIGAVFECKCNFEAAEHSRDIMNAIVEAGGYITCAYLRRSALDGSADNSYVADWEFATCKGYHGEPDDGDIPEEKLYGLDLKEWY